MKKSKRLFFVALMVTIFSMTIGTSVLAADNSINGLDFLIIKVDENNYVKVNISDYAIALRLKQKSPLYIFLKGENPTIYIEAIYSINADKYIDISEYALALRLNKKDISKSIESAPRLDLDTVKTFKEFKGFDDDGNVILEPVIPEEPSEPTATVTITPHSLLNEGFKLANVKVNVSGIEGAAKYSITYSVYDNDNNEKTVTTKLANVGQVNEDLIQYIDAETSKIKVNLFDVNNNQINTEYKTTIK